MHYNRDVFVTQFERLKWFVYHLTYYRILQKSYEERQLQSEFWTMTIDAHLLRATIDWCMVFGNKNEPTHWRRLVKQSEGLVRNFHEGLFQELSLDKKLWEEYWQA